MTTFNFTVRATDNLGAYADRDFSIDVRNTVVERFVMVGATDAASSNDGINWTVRPGAGGAQVVNILGRWFVFPSVIGNINNSQSYKTSTDAINWTTGAFNTSDPSISSLPFAYGSSIYILARNPANNGSGVWHPNLYSTTDGVTWTLVSSLASGQYAPYASTGDGGYLPAYNGTSMVFLRAKLSQTATQFGMYSTNGGTSFTLLTTTNTNLPSGEFFTDFKYINGLWIATSGVTGGKIYLSTDLAFWSAYTPGGVAAATSSLPQFVYGNGRLALTSSTSSGGSGNPFGVRTSETGKTWTLRTIVASPGSAATNIGIAFNNGVFVTSCIGTGTNSVYYSNDAITWTTGTSPASGLGMIAGLSQG